jgi:hypothetical protein
VAHHWAMTAHLRMSAPTDPVQGACRGQPELVSGGRAVFARSAKTFPAEGEVGEVGGERRSECDRATARMSRHERRDAGMRTRKGKGAR